MKIGITGASGFLGSHLCAKLSGTAHQITILSHQKKADYSNWKNFEVFEGSIENFTQVSEFLDGVEIVFHLIGLIAETKTKTFEKTVSGGTKNLVEAAIAKKVKKIIYISALGTSPAAETAYHKSKYYCEQQIIKSEIPYLIFRPSLIYGLNDGFVTMLTRMIKYSPVVPVMGNGKYLLQPVYIDDLISCMIQAIDLLMAENKIIDIAGKEKLEYCQILNILKQVLGVKRLNLKIPMAFMKIIAGIFEKLFKPAPLTRDQLKMLEMGNVGDITLMKQLFQIDPLGFEEGLTKYMR